MSIHLFERQSPIEITFGHYFKSHPLMKKTRKFATIHNVLNTLDWVGRVSVISGLARCAIIGIIAVRHRKDLSSDVKAMELIRRWFVVEFARGMVATLGFGYLLMMPDILFNMHRYTKPCPRRQNPAV